MVRSGDIDPAFVAVLNLNIDDAQAKQEENNRLAVLGHIYTRVQEELEKRAKPAVGLLHKLMRLADQPGIRANLLEFVPTPPQGVPHASCARARRKDGIEWKGGKLCANPCELCT
jgi:hypothetical protein